VSVHHRLVLSIAAVSFIASQLTVSVIVCHPCPSPLLALVATLVSLKVAVRVNTALLVLGASRTRLTNDLGFVLVLYLSLAAA